MKLEKRERLISKVTPTSSKIHFQSSLSIAIGQSVREFIVNLTHVDLLLRTDSTASRTISRLTQLPIGNLVLYLKEVIPKSLVRE